MCDRTFTIDSSDHTSVVLMPPLLEFSHQTAPSINFQMIGLEKDSVGDLLEQGAIDKALNEQRLDRQIAFTTPHMMVLLKSIAQTIEA